MKKLVLLLSILACCSHWGMARDIFKECGFDKKPLTLSNGRYNEFFKNEEVVQIGTVLLNTKTNKVVAFVDEENIKSQYPTEHSSRWLSIDPLAAKYAQYSPYTYCLNNPIIFVDPDGQEVWKSTHVHANGTKTITLNFDIRVKNSGGFSSANVARWSGKIASQIETSFNGKSSDGKTTYVAKVNMDLSGKDNGNNYTMDFVSDVKDGNGNLTVNYGRMDGEYGDTKDNNMQIKAPGEDNGAFEEQTEEGVGRTGAHEVGHTGNLRHPSSEDNKLEGTDEYGNLMHQSWNPKAGDNLKSNQLDEFNKHVQEGTPDYLK
nr:hypothetical protein [uncultured Draconibacterium sp.]